MTNSPNVTVDDDIDIRMTVDGTGSSSGAVTSVDGKTGAVQILPVGGTTGQVLAKASATNYDVEWVENGGSVDPEDIAAAVEAYMEEHPITESDPTVPSWAKASTKPSYTAAEVGALPSDTVIPTKTSDLTNDSGFITTAPVASVNGRTGAVTGLEEQTTVVNKTSSDTSQTLAANTFYIWPEMSALTITCPATGGPYAFRFTSGSTATTLTMTGITMPDDFTVEANKTYEINVYQGYGLAVSWS